MKRILCLALIGLTGCASAKVGDVSGTVNIGAKPPVAVVTTITKTCEPPLQYLTKAAPLPAIQLKRLSPQALLGIALQDADAYNGLAIDNAALIDWVKQNCQ